MWTLDNLPLTQLEQRYGFTPDAAWVEQVQKASIDFGGGSGAFVSPEGLAITNHHVALGQLHKLSSAGRDLVRDGFTTRGPADEVKCPDLELKVLDSYEDVTSRVRAAVEPARPESEQSALRRAEIARIEKESSDRTGLYSRVVELYRGGQYWLYRYRKFTDVRLVMAPEERFGSFGGDWDNFGYPRHDLDIAFFRVYVDGKPYRPERWLRFSATGPREDELVFVAGHPGSTSRFKTVAQLETERDATLPIRIRQQERRLEAMRAHGALGPEQARQVVDRIRGLENNLKRQRAFLGLLRDPALMESKRAAEARLRERVAAAAAGAEVPGSAEVAEAAGSWDRIAAVQAEYMARHRQHLGRDLARVSRLTALAEDLVRRADEIEKPNEARLAEYRDQNLESLRLRTLSPAPLYPEVDAASLAAQLADALEMLGPDDPWVRAALGGREPAVVATELMRGTKLADVGERRRLWDGGRKAVRASKDPLIAWVRGLDPHWREMRAWYDDAIQGVEAHEGGHIARARFDLDGRSAYADATGTLRLSIGRVAGYEQLTSRVPWKTNFGMMFARSDAFDGKPPFDVPARVAAARGRIDPATPLNFVTTNDIIGGNSGSPVFTRDLQYVGIVFDGNVQAFIWDYAFDEVQARCVNVHSAGILEALVRIYDMPWLAQELTGRLTGAR
jgi:hypothetical protein